MDGLAETLLTAMNATSHVNQDEVLDLLSMALVSVQAESMLQVFESGHAGYQGNFCNGDYGCWMHEFSSQGGSWWAPSASDFSEWQAMGPNHSLSDLHDATYNDPVSQFEHGLNPTQWSTFVEKMYYYKENLDSGFPGGGSP
jgi:hypothetical protein